MLSPVKAVTAGALLAALGVTFLIARPFEQGEPTPPSAITGDGFVAPVAVSAKTAPGDCSPATIEAFESVEQSRGRLCHPSYEWNDERLEGTVTWGLNEDLYTDGSGLSVRSFALSIENEDGAWRSRPVPRLYFPDKSESPAEVWVLDGEGAYKGLTLVLLMASDYSYNQGYIIGQMPDAPENASQQ